MSPNSRIFDPLPVYESEDDDDIQFKRRSMSDSILSDLDFKNQMA